MSNFGPLNIRKDLKKDKKSPETMNKYFDRMAAERKETTRKRKVIHYNDLLTKEERGSYDIRITEKKKESIP